MPGWPTKLSPIMPERPRPSSVSARPVATWLVTSVSVRKPNSSENSAPTMIAANDAEPGRAGGERDGETGHRAHDHHALDAEVEHAGALDDQLAQRSDEQRRRCGGDGDDDLLKHSGPPPLPWPALPWPPLHRRCGRGSGSACRRRARRRAACPGRRARPCRRRRSRSARPRRRDR